MKANELRIGNLVHGSRYNGIVTVLNKNACVLKHKSGIARLKIEDLEPIPLTEEWLLKYGFKEEGLGGIRWYEKNIAGVKFLTNDIGKDAYSKKLEFVFNEDLDTIRIEYLHELQNLYFAFTRREL